MQTNYLKKIVYSYSSKNGTNVFHTFHIKLFWIMYVNRMCKNVFFLKRKIKIFPPFIGIGEFKCWSNFQLVDSIFYILNDVIIKELNNSLDIYEEHRKSKRKIRLIDVWFELLFSKTIVFTWEKLVIENLLICVCDIVLCSVLASIDIVY